MYVTSGAQIRGNSVTVTVTPPVPGSAVSTTPSRTVTSSRPTSVMTGHPASPLTIVGVSSLHSQLAGRSATSPGSMSTTSTT